MTARRYHATAALAMLAQAIEAIACGWFGDAATYLNHGFESHWERATDDGNRTSDYGLD